MTIRLTWKRVLATLAGLAAAGLLFAWSGIFNIAASSGHWAITDWFLHWTMRNSVKTHAFFDSPSDPIATEGQLVSAAGHFAAACASCHGAPGQRPSTVMQKATPPAPDLSVNARKWSDAQLFYILRHGVKYTGMPAWAAEGRDDEIRRMVAFVRRLPGMTPAQYRSLSGQTDGAGAQGAGTTDARALGSNVLAGCVACHGADGRGRGQRDIPILGGQRAGYLEAALAAYADGRRASAVMANAAATLTPGERRALAAHFAALPGLPGTAGMDSRARTIVERGLPQWQLPACASCHGAGKPQPVLTGQRAGYIAARLRYWKGDGKEIDARLPQNVMPVIARRIPEEMIDPLARYLAGETR
ncbi:c-type cytochrome [Sphingomonas endophytica]|uniref:Cytochrome C n=1 Tax=Sphingomonas endophytica TaxID=869719 RepID=A0A147I5G9_9SPHN|nr:c-type cytochrome [Sphingomonas endophytica]KTT73757.1 cytochrome C [Sphingomonas endophytica]